MKKFMAFLLLILTSALFTQEITLTGKDFDSWKAIGVMPGSVNTTDSLAVIKEINPEGAYGGVESPEYIVEFKKNPLIIIDVEPNNSWALKMSTKNGEKWGYYIQGDTSEKGELSIDLNKSLKMYNPGLKVSEEESVKFWIIAVGKEGTEVKVKSFDMIYQ